MNLLEKYITDISIFISKKYNISKIKSINIISDIINYNNDFLNTNEMEIVEKFCKKFPKTWDKFSEETTAHLYLAPMQMSKGFGNDIKFYNNGLLFNMALWTIDKGYEVFPHIFRKPNKANSTQELKADYLIDLYQMLWKTWDIMENRKIK